MLYDEWENISLQLLILWINRWIKSIIVCVRVCMRVRVCVPARVCMRMSVCWDMHMRV